jgi:LysB family phage lysis regulatory protein
MTAISSLRQLVYGLALLGSLALLLWAQQQRIKLADSATRHAIGREATAQEAAERHRLSAETMLNTLNDERQAQTRLRTTQNQLRQSLASRQQQIEELKRENKELQDWAAQPLPDLARRLRQRPALTGADAYHQWMSGRGALPVAGDTTEQ